MENGSAQNPKSLINNRFLNITREARNVHTIIIFSPDATLLHCIKCIMPFIPPFQFSFPQVKSNSLSLYVTLQNFEHV